MTKGSTTVTPSPPMRRLPPFNVFPGMGYWEIDGKPVSAREAEHWINLHAKWKPAEDRQPEAKTP